MIDIIFVEGDIVVDDNGNVHGPLRKRDDQLGLCAFSWSWDFHGRPLDGCHAALHGKFPLPNSAFAFSEEPDFAEIGERNDDVIVITRSRGVAIETHEDLARLLAWLKGFCAGDMRGDNHPPGIAYLDDLVFCLRHELKKGPDHV